MSFFLYRFCVNLLYLTAWNFLFSDFWPSWKLNFLQAEWDGKRIKFPQPGTVICELTLTLAKNTEIGIFPPETPTTTSNNNLQPILLEKMYFIIKYNITQIYLIL